MTQSIHARASAAPGTMAFAEGMRLLCLNEMAMPPGVLVSAFSAHAYAEGLRAMSGRPTHHLTRIHEALETYRGIRLAFAILERPGMLDKGALHPTSYRTGVSIGPDALRKHAESLIEVAREAWDRAGRVESDEGLHDGPSTPSRGGDFRKRFLAVRMASVLAPSMYRDMLNARGADAQAGRIVSRWWRSRLGELGVTGLDELRLDAFERSLSDIVTLVSPTSVGVEFHADACLSVALFEAGIPVEAAEACRGSMLLVDHLGGIVSAAATGETVGRFDPR